MVYYSDMGKWIITGASGSVATACINILLANQFTIDAYSRNKLNVYDKNINFDKVTDYKNIMFNMENCECLLIAQGYFKYHLVENMQIEDLQSTIEANFTSQIDVLHAFLKQVKKDRRINIVILGSTSSYDAGLGTVIYGAAKAGTLALVKALNKEYVDTDIRFWLISFGTLANKMGSKVPNQELDSLLDVDMVAQEIFDKVNNKSNLWQPEIVIRRRHIRTTN
jgi:NADP-dependent 3-hydroxy acid dehydrogenase YdfG